jgi:hypothetical protein
MEVVRRSGAERAEVLQECNKSATRVLQRRSEAPALREQREEVTRKVKGESRGER